MELQNAVLQSPWWKRCLCSIYMMVSCQRNQYERTGQYFSFPPSICIHGYQGQKLLYWLCAALYWTCVWLWGNTLMEFPLGVPVIWVAYITGLIYISTFPSHGCCFTTWFGYQATFDDHMMRWRRHPWRIRGFLFWGFWSWQNKQGMGQLVTIYWILRR